MTDFVHQLNCLTVSILIYNTGFPDTEIKSSNPLNLDAILKFLVLFPCSSVPEHFCSNPVVPDILTASLLLQL